MEVPLLERSLQLRDVRHLVATTELTSVVAQVAGSHMLEARQGDISQHHPRHRGIFTAICRSMLLLGR
jgi:hypothetical protein